MGEGAPGVSLSAIDLADRADFRIGRAEISPSTHILRGPGGETSVEPLVMQVLLALCDAQGRVVSREALFGRCWGNVTVGEDSLNRIIAEARRAAKSIAPDSFEIQTIPRTGYRLVPLEGHLPVLPSATPPLTGAKIGRGDLPRSRRLVVGAGAAGAAALATAGVGWWTLSPDPIDAQVAALIGQSEQAMRTNLPDSDAQGVGFLKEAVTLQPDNSLAWGRLALAMSIVAEHAPPDRAAAAVQGVQDAARRALSLDGREPDALSALAILPPYFGDWFAAEQRMKQVLAVDRDHLPTRDHLDFMYAAVRRGREGSTEPARCRGSRFPPCRLSVQTGLRQLDPGADQGGRPCRRPGAAALAKTSRRMVFPPVAFGLYRPSGARAGACRGCAGQARPPPANDRGNACVDDRARHPACARR